LRADEDSQCAVLEELAELGAPGHDIAEQLLAPWPLAQPGRFDEAHESMMRALEVLDRNGGRKAAVNRVGPLNPLASVIVSRVAGGIAGWYRSSLVQRIRRLYATREASSVPGSREHRMLRRARLQAAVVNEAFGAHGGVPATALSELGPRVKAGRFIQCSWEVVCLREGCRRRLWMIRRRLRDEGFGLAPWTPCLIWARGRERWRPVT
jgi:hypothetical protein